MPLFDCAIPCIICPPGLDGEQPGLNLTSEAVDEDPFIGRYYTWDPPPLDSIFTAQGCVSFCLSTVSQEEANLCAQRQDALCTSVNWPGPRSDPTAPGGVSVGPRRLFGNAPQTCDANCPENPQTITVPANTYFAFNQATANQMAHSLACIRASHVICLSNLSDTMVCRGADSSVSISAPGAVEPCTWGVVSGSLPPGMSILQDGSNVMFISGTPTSTGEYMFTILMTDDAASGGSDTYTLTVLGITTANPLPDADENTFYSNVNTANPPGIGIYTWALTAGSLPSGVSLDPATGTISGIPAIGSAGTYNFTVGVTP